MSTENQGQSASFFQKATKLEKRAFIIGKPFIQLFKSITVLLLLSPYLKHNTLHIEYKLLKNLPAPSATIG